MERNRQLLARLLENCPRTVDQRPISAPALEGLSPPALDREAGGPTLRGPGGGHASHRLGAVPSRLLRLVTLLVLARLCLGSILRQGLHPQTPHA